MIVPAASIAIGALLATAFERSAMTMDTVVETNSIELLRRAAMVGDTISFLSEIEAEADCRLGTLVFIPPAWATGADAGIGLGRPARWRPGRSSKQSG